MVKQIFVNLPVKDLEKTKEFWTKLGFTFNAQFTDENAAALELGENISAMLLTENFFKTFTKKEIANNSIEVINAISVESKEKVDEIVGKAMDAGGSEPEEKKDYGWMYYRSFEDLDGHHWEVTFIDEANIPKDPSSSQPS
jgi:uncharacterized protein